MKTRNYKQFYQSVGLRLYEARQAKGWSMRQLSEKTGAAPGAICAYEAGEQVPRADRLRDLCVALEVSADWVLGLKEKEA